MGKKRTKTDFTEQRARVERAREYIARKEEEIRLRRARGAAEQKRD
jgi:hypothetical protein